MKHLRSILIRNIKNESIENSCNLYFTVHCSTLVGSWLTLIELQNTKDSSKKGQEILAYTSETVADTVNPEWNEFGNPVDISEDAVDERGLFLCIY